MNQKQWSLDTSSFMVLVGESEEFRYRTMQRSLLECLAAAPVAGLQSYLHSTHSLCEATGLSYFSPFGLKHAPLRNMRLTHSIHHQKLLQDGQCRVYHIPEDRPLCEWSRWVLCWTITTWVAFSAIVATLVLSGKLSWIGLTNSTVFVGWSILARLADRYCMENATLNTSSPDAHDAIFILGRRNSCLVLEGRRGDIAKWTGCGIRQKPGALVEAILYLRRISTLCVLFMVFLTIPNGTTCDQVAFIAVNLLGQVNVLIGQGLAANLCFSHLSLVETNSVPTRTHVYAFLLRKFGDGVWVDAAGLLPKMDVWRSWRALCVQDISSDGKELYEQCEALSTSGRLSHRTKR